ncbi:MAG: ABC transporter permease subunit [Actinomycetota bacterium]|nr:ABC transporter permease subunit [Actinomycetota bacterium]
MTKRILAPIVGIVVFLAAWEGLVRAFKVRRYILRAPSSAVRYLWRFRSDFLDAAGTTAQHAAIGLLISLAVALLVGAVLASNRFLEMATQPVLVLVQVVPWIAYVASVVVWLGAGNGPVLFMVALVCLPAFVFATVDGMRSVEPASLELLASVDAGRWETLRRLRLPAAAPTLFTAARFNIGLALATTYYVEGSNADNQGLGYIGIRAASSSTGADRLWATVFAMAMLGVIALAVLSWAQRTLLHWHAAQRSQPH